MVFQLVVGGATITENMRRFDYRLARRRGKCDLFELFHSKTVGMLHHGIVMDDII